MEIKEIYLLIKEAFGNIDKNDYQNLDNKNNSQLPAIPSSDIKKSSITQTKPTTGKVKQTNASLSNPVFEKSFIDSAILLSSKIYNTAKANDTKTVTPPQFKNWEIGYADKNSIKTGKFGAFWETDIITAKIIVNTYTKNKIDKMRLIKYMGHESTIKFIVLRYR